jgi:cytochrome c oxidase cbb3-type subunit 3
MSAAWSWYVVALTLIAIAGCVWLLLWSRTARAGEPAPGEAFEDEVDGIRELNSPLPRWWLALFLGTIVFSLGYLLLYPGLGTFPGLLGWTSEGQHADAVQQAQRHYAPLYARYAAMPVAEVARDPVAVAIGSRLFANTCSTCHGSDARGGVGYPNLTDGVWKWGGAPEVIETSILDGRSGVMAPFAAAIGGEEGIPAMVAYVQSLSGKHVDPGLRAAGEAKFRTVCIACHGMEGRGNPGLGAPDLTDDDWLYGSSEQAIADGLRYGRKGVMPAHRDLLGAERAHLVAAYVYSLSHADRAPGPQARTAGATP